MEDPKDNERLERALGNHRVSDHTLVESGYRVGYLMGLMTALEKLEAAKLTLAVNVVQGMVDALSGPSE